MSTFIINSATSDKEIYKKAHEMVDKVVDVEGVKDPFYTTAAEIGLSAFFGLTKINAEKVGKDATLDDFYEIYALSTYRRKEYDSLNALFEEAGELHPENKAVCLWSNFLDVSERTKNCIYGIMDSAVNIAMVS